MLTSYLCNFILSCELECIGCPIGVHVRDVYGIKGVYDHMFFGQFSGGPWVHCEHNYTFRAVICIFTHWPFARIKSSDALNLYYANKYSSLAARRKVI